MLLSAFLAWVCLTWGMTYLISSAEITDPIRVRLTAWKPILATLMTCRACTSAWTGQAAVAAVLGLLSGLSAPPPWHAWIYLPPTGGVAAVGLIDLLAFCKRRTTNG